MHLDREAILAIEQLEEQGKARRVGHVCAEDLSASLRPKIVQGSAAERLVMDDALRIFAIDEFPRFADADAGRQAFSVERFQPSSSPDTSHEERLENDGSREGHG